jgi:hypothetical protein
VVLHLQEYRQIHRVRGKNRHEPIKAYIQLQSLTPEDILFYLIDLTRHFRGRPHVPIFRTVFNSMLALSISPDRLLGIRRSGVIVSRLSE